MNKTLLASIAALLITTAPICADTTTSTYSNTTVTVSDDETTFSSTTRSQSNEQSLTLLDIEHREAQFLKGAGALYASFGLGAMALAYKHYEDTKLFTPDIHVLGQQYDAMTTALCGAFCTAVGIVVYRLAPKTSYEQ